MSVCLIHNDLRRVYFDSKLHDAFVNINSNEISLSEANVVFKVVTNREFTKEELEAIVASKKG